MSALAGTAKSGDPKYFPKAAGGFKRAGSNVINWIEEGGEFPPEAGRYHLIVNFGCGWCGRVLAARLLKGLEGAISVTHTNLVIQPVHSWAMRPDDEFAVASGWKSAYDVYNWDGLGYGDGSQSYGKRQLAVPIMVDKITKRVVSNDSAQICLMLNGAFPLISNSLNLYPDELVGRVEAVNDVVYPGLNDGVYRCKFARSDEAYEEAHINLYKCIAFIEATLATSTYLCGEQLTLADVRTFPHLIRFDTIYRHMMLRPPLSANPKLPPGCVAYLARLLTLPAFAEANDTHLATCGYFNQMGHETSVEDCNAIYDANRYDFLPTRAEYEQQRLKLNIPPDPSRHVDKKEPGVYNNNI